MKLNIPTRLRTGPKQGRSKPTAVGRQEFMNVNELAEPLRKILEAELAIGNQIQGRKVGSGLEKGIVKFWGRTKLIGCND